jgi:hypothetical protein
MQKTRELPFLGSYGFNQTPYRYFFLKEDGEHLEEYKKAIIKCLKYDILYDLLPDHETGHETYDALRPPVTVPVQLASNKFAKVFHESVQGVQSGEIVVTYKFSEDRKSMELTLYDRNTALQPLRDALDDDAPIQYALVDQITESTVKITKGKKITTKDIHVYTKPEKFLGEQPHSYEDSMKVIKQVKSKLSYPLEDPTDLLTEEKAKKETKTTKNKRG